MNLVLSLLGASLVYVVFLIYQRLFLSPIAHFPGPKLAAATYLYEFYYDIILGGKYLWKIKEMHEKYGPVIRINPGGLHVTDPSFWDVMYTSSTERNRREKWTWETWAQGIPLSTNGTVPHALHKLRRSAISPFFSKQNVRLLEPGIEERINTLTARFHSLGKTGDVFQLQHAFSAFTNDVVSQFCFGRSHHRIEAPDFDPMFNKTSYNAARFIALTRHIPWILNVMWALPESIAMKMGEEMSANVTLRREQAEQIEDTRRNGFEKVDAGNKTIFHTVLQSELPEKEKETMRLAEEALLLIGGGTHTTSWTLTVIAFYLINNPSLLRKLREELKSVLPSVESNAPLAELEKLSFLSAVVKEGLRVGNGVGFRSSRIAPDTALKCGNWTIPAGTPVAMTIPLTHWNESIFPNPHTFDPHRWLSPDSVHLEKYLVSFSKGSRNCMGMNLALAELYICAATVFRRFGSKEVREPDDLGVLELFETDESDVRMASERFFSVAKDDSKGVRVKIS